jgi:hypothetical protein
VGMLTRSYMCGGIARKRPATVSQDSFSYGAWPLVVAAMKAW